MNKATIPISKVRDETGFTVNFIRARIRDGTFPIGAYIPKTVSKKKTDRYLIFKEKYEAFKRENMGAKNEDSGR